MIIKGDCIEEMKKLPDNSVDAIITDPPYGLEFMGKDWDKFKEGKNIAGGNTGKDTPYARSKPTPAFYQLGIIEKKGFQDFTFSWAIECLRVLKPGGFLLSFGGTRTYHRLVCGIEDAGFEIRDTIMWLYGSGFPKSLNIGKQIDKLNGRTKDDFIELGKYLKEMRGEQYTKKELGKKIFNFDSNREDVPIHTFESGKDIPTQKIYDKLKEILGLNNKFDELIKRIEAEREVIGKDGRTAKDSIFNIGVQKEWDLTTANLPEAKQWEGWGTALKPAVEPIVVARKPLSEKNVALNVLKWGTGGINIDECRIEGGERDARENKTSWGISRVGEENNIRGNKAVGKTSQGRFPANIILDEEAGKMLDEQSGFISQSGRLNRINNKVKANPFKGFSGDEKTNWTYSGHEHFDKGGASRFFYCAKSSKRERNTGMESFINMEVFKEVCTEKGLIKEERLTHLLMDMDTLQEKGIEESILMDDLGWNTMLFGKKIMEKYQKGFMSIIKMKTNLTILQRTYNWLIHLLIKEYTLDANSLKEIGGNHAEDVEKSKELIITINEKLELALGVKGVVSGMQLKIKLKDGRNIHPTCKPVSIMEYLVKLVSKENATILDPFLGSGTTAIACLKLSRKFIGIEKEEEYIKIAKARIKPFMEQRKL